jgi:outer membrane protein assembly factor BamB
MHRAFFIRHFAFVIAPAFALAARAELPPLPQPATSFGAVIAEGWLYAYGGNTGKAHEFNRECVKGDFFRVRLPDGAAWETLPGGTALLSVSLVAHEGKIIRIGGMNARNEKGAKNDLHSTDEVVRYDPATQQWTPLPPLPEPRSSHDSVLVGDTLYVGGGWRLAGDDGEGVHAQWHTTLLALDLRAPERGWRSVAQPFQRRALAAVAGGGRLWFLGGMDGEDEPSRAVDWHEPATGQWGKGPDLPDGSMAGFGIAGCAAGGRVLASPLSGKISALSADRSQWEEIAKLTPARFFHRLLPLADGRVLAVGGSNRQGHVKTIEIVALDAPPAPAAVASGPEPTPVAAVQLPSEPGTGAPWPQWRGPNRDGISTETGWRKDWPAEGMKPLWRATVGVGMSSSVVAGGRLITQGNDGEGRDHVLALDAATGAELWRFTFPCKTDAHEMPIVPSGPGATPTLVAGHVFALSREGDLLCLDVTNGQPAWRKNLVADLGGKRPVYGYAQSLLVSGGRLYLDLGGASGSTAALDAATGAVVWRAGSGEAGYSAARLFERDGQRLVAMFKGEALDVFDPADGRVVWSHRITGRDFTNAATPAFVGHRVLVSNTSVEMAALLDWDSGPAPNVRPAWQHKQFALLFNSAVAHEGCLFAFNEKRRGHHEFTCVDAATGATHWVSDAVPTSTFLLADGHWLFLTREGEVVLAPATARALKPTARFQALEGKCYATPTLAAGRLYVRDNTGALAAFDLRPPPPP